MKFKDDIVESRFPLMHEQAQKLAVEMDNWIKHKFGLELTLTATVSTKAEDMELSRVSDTHRTGRAFDVRTRDLPENVIAELCAHFRKKYANIAALSGGQKNLIVYRPHGTGPHLHVQLNRNFSKGDINVEESIKKD
jgi:hypothetical protein